MLPLSLVELLNTNSAFSHSVPTVSLLVASVIFGGPETAALCKDGP